MLDTRAASQFLVSRTIRLPPLSIIEKWPKPNYDHPVTRGPALPIVSVICATLALIVVLMRFYTRFVILRAPGLDDLFIFLALVSSKIAVNSEATY
jgi:hypothetical protein